MPHSVPESLAHSPTDAVTLHDERGVALSVSGNTESVFGASARGLETGPLWKLARSDDAAVLAGEFRAVTLDGATRYVEWIMEPPRPGEAPQRVETRIARMPQQPGGETLLLCISRQPVGRDDRDAELLRRYEEGRAFIDRATYGIYRSTRDGRFQYVNHALVKMLGYESADELCRIDIATQLYADPLEREVLVRRLQEGRLGGWTHVRWKTRDGTVIIVRSVVSAVKDEADNIVFFEGIVEDVTESLRREELLRRNERMASLGTMLAGVAHELNNPLAAISGFAQIILRGDTLNEEDRGAVDTINHEANRAARIVRDLQTFSKERTYLLREEVDLNDIISYVLSSQRYKMETHGIRREVSLAPALPSVRAERVHVEQILINLIANACQALESITDAPANRANGSTTRVPPTVSIRTAVRGTEVMVEVQDNGPGIAPEHLTRIFDPFFTTRREGEGTGLGLAVVHGIVSSYSGNLEVETEEGRGSLFRVTFPIVSDHDLDEDSGMPPGTPDALPTVAVKPLEILIVEDELAIRRLLARYFESRGHRVTAAEDGIAALRAAEQSAFDVVICDLRLPGIDGFEVLRRLRELPTGAQSRCILMSGANAKSPEGPLRDVLRLAAIVDKPFEIEQLRQVVEA